MKYYYLVGDLNAGAPIMNNIYYFDNNATTLIYDSEIKKAIIDWISCGNPSNTLHDFGLIAHNKIEQCRHSIAKRLCVSSKEVYFTSGATESNNIVVQGTVNYYLEKNPKDKFTIITSTFEHPSVVNIFKHYQENEPNIEVLFVEPCKNPDDPEFGCIKASDLEDQIKLAKYKIILVSIMHANNETGAIQNIQEIGTICKKYNLFFHCDATQTMGKYEIHPHQCYIGALSFSGHKFHGPKGIGGLFLSQTHNDVMNLCFGGEQEGSKRPGTENIANIIGLALALNLVHQDRNTKNNRLKQLTEYIIQEVGEQEKIRILGAKRDKSLPNTILMLIENIGTCNKMLVKDLNKRKIYVSVGSACQTNSNHSSHVLDTMGLEKKDKIKVIRISLSDYTTEEECQYLVRNLVDAIRENRIKSIKKN